ncbi:nuclear transport factor 2 family protein [Sandaracinobacteroides sp. A072]|uniref:nuclear transport factor 2 family protein n=1 Tax=Sandaracinobacteroides sp. A072 TaxID=3461146 RepID=UPI004040F423
MADPAAARDAIRNLLARYTYNGDRGRIEALAACFAPDGVLEFPGNRAVGPDAILSALTGGTPGPGPRPGFVRHHITNPLITLDGDAATARSYFTVFTDIGPDHAGTYTDRLVRTGDAGLGETSGWRFAHRLVRIDWQSQASLFRPMATRRPG